MFKTVLIRAAVVHAWTSEVIYTWFYLDCQWKQEPWYLLDGVQGAIPPDRAGMTQVP